MPRIVKLTLAAVVSVIALAGAALIVAVFVLEGEDYVDLAAPIIEEALGWRLEVQGPVSVDPSLTFGLTGHKAVLTRGQTRLAEARRASFRLELPALLSGQFRFSVDVQDPVIQFSIDQAGKTNWNFEQFAEKRGGFPLEVVIAGISASNGGALLRDDASQTALELDLDEFLFREAGGQYEFGFNFVSAYERASFRAAGKVGASLTFDTLSPDLVVYLLNARDQGSFAASADPSLVTARDRSPDDQHQPAGGDAGPGGGAPRLMVAGALRQWPDDPVADLKVRLQASDLADFSSMFGIALPSVSPLQMAGEVELRRDSYQLKGLQASVGESDLAGSVVLYTNESRPRLVAKLSSERLQLKQLLPDRSAGTAEEKKPSPADRVFSDQPIPLDWLDTFNGQIEVHAKQLVLYRRFSDAGYRAQVDNGTLELSQAYGVQDGSLKIRLRIDNRRSPPSFTLLETARDVPLAFVLGLPEGIIVGGKVDGQAQIEGRGGTPRALAASLSGSILFEMGEARLVEAGLKKVSTDLLSSILGSFSPTSADDQGDVGEGGYTQYHCGVFGIKIEDGVLRSDRAIALESKEFNIGGDGYVDLKKETIDLAIHPKAKTGLGLSISALLGGFSVGGTLASPNVQLNKAGVVVTAAVGAAVKVLQDWVTVNDFSCSNTRERIRKQLETDPEKTSGS